MQMNFMLSSKDAKVLKIQALNKQGILSFQDVLSPGAQNRTCAPPEKLHCCAGTLMPASSPGTPGTAGISSP